MSYLSKTVWSKANNAKTKEERKQIIEEALVGTDADDITCLIIYMTPERLHKSKMYLELMQRYEEALKRFNEKAKSLAVTASQTN